jgi:hypothetical protein
VVAEVQKWLREQDVPLYRQGPESIIVHYDKCLKKLWDCVEKCRTNVQTYPFAFLVSVYLNSPEKKENTLSDLPWEFKIFCKNLYKIKE